MIRGLLSNAYIALCTNTAFTIYYYPWICPAKFLIQYEQYM
ncbi:unnamed protein product, partial [Cuscuta epithymum]